MLMGYGWVCNERDAIAPFLRAPPSSGRDAVWRKAWTAAIVFEKRLTVVPVRRAKSPQH